MSGEEINPRLVVANLRGPQTLDLNGIDRMRHAPAIDPHPPVSERHRRQLHPQTFKLGDKGFDNRCDKSMTVKDFPRDSRFPLQCWVANTIHSCRSGGHFQAATR